MKRTFLTMALAALTLPAAAQGVYRCGSTYSQQPCPGGSEVETLPAPSAKEQSRSIQAARQQAKAADAMEKARLKEEAKPVSVYIPPPKAEVEEPDKSKVSKPKKRKKPEYFTAVAPADKKAKKTEETRK